MPHLTYSDESYSDIITINRYRNDDWMLIGFTAGLSQEKWSAELFVENLTDERAEISSSFSYDRERVTYARPLTAGVRLAYDF